MDEEQLAIKLIIITEDLSLPHRLLQPPPTSTRIEDLTRRDAHDLKDRLTCTILQFEEELRNRRPT